MVSRLGTDDGDGFRDVSAYRVTVDQQCTNVKIWSITTDVSITCDLTGRVLIRKTARPSRCSASAATFNYRDEVLTPPPSGRLVYHRKYLMDITPPPSRRLVYLTTPLRETVKKLIHAPMS